MTENPPRLTEATLTSPRSPRPSVASNDSAIRHSRLQIDSKLVYQVGGPCDFVFLIHARGDDAQRVCSETLTIDPPLQGRLHALAGSGNRMFRIQANSGLLSLRYQAVVEKRIDPIDHSAAEASIHELPDDILRFLMPSRYCESDHLSTAAQQQFCSVEPGYARVQAVNDWVRENIAYRIGTSNPLTTARDVFVQRTGVCRDFAHLSISFCRALNIPARLVAGYSRFPEPPPDFHAVFEAYIGGRWVMFDPTGMVDPAHVVTIATGGDAKDVAFATIFGPATMVSMSPDVEILDDGGITQLG